MMQLGDGATILGRQVVIVVPSLKGGGAERSAAALASALANAGAVVIVITIGGIEAGEYELPPVVVRHALGLRHDSGGVLSAVLATLRRVSALRKELRAILPSCAIAFLDPTAVVCIAAATGLRVPVIAASRNAPNKWRENRVPRRWIVLRNVCFRFAAAIVVQTDRAAVDISEFAPRASVAVVPNFVADSASPALAYADGEDRHLIVAAGRLSWEKGFDILLNALARIRGDLDALAIKVVIAGEGPLRAELQRSIDELGLVELVALPGHVGNLRSLLSKARLFVLSSRTEGFPNVMLEAMSEGVPVVACDCDYGPREISDNGRVAWLVPLEDVQQLARAMLSVCSSDATALHLSDQGRSFAQTFTPERVSRQWIALISDTVVRRATK